MGDPPIESNRMNIDIDEVTRSFGPVGLHLHSRGTPAALGALAICVGLLQLALRSDRGPGTVQLVLAVETAAGADLTAGDLALLRNAGGMIGIGLLGAATVGGNLALARTGRRTALGQRNAFTPVSSADSVQRRAAASGSMACASTPRTRASGEPISVGAAMSQSSQ